ncbi:MAG: hypothetical protein QM808_13830 [Steroidobacteraceae bacterium]
MNQKVEPLPSSLSSADGAAHHFDQAAHDRQAKARAAEMARGRRVGLDERLEQSL